MLVKHRATFGLNAIMEILLGKTFDGKTTHITVLVENKILGRTMRNPLPNRAVSNPLASVQSPHFVQNIKNWTEWERRTLKIAI